jgi:hypothetical protein
MEVHGCRGREKALTLPGDAVTSEAPEGAKWEWGGVPVPALGTERKAASEEQERSKNGAAGAADSERIAEAWVAATALAHPTVPGVRRKQSVPAATARQERDTKHGATSTSQPMGLIGSRNAGSARKWTGDAGLATREAFGSRSRR